MEIRPLGEDGHYRPLGPQTGDEKHPEAVEAQFNVGRPAIIQPGDGQNLPFAVNFDQIPFDASGAFAFILSIDGAEAERLPFRVTGPPARRSRQPGKANRNTPTTT